MTPPRHWRTGLQRLLAATLALSLLLAAVVAVLAPVWHKHRQYDAAIDDLQFQLQRLERVLERRDHIEAERQRLLVALESEDATLPPVGAAVAGARLQAHLQSLAERAGGLTINSVQSLEAVPAGPFYRIGVRLQTRGDLESLARFLYLAETEQPLAWVDQLQIQPDRRAAGMTRLLDAAMTVTTLMSAGVLETR